MLGALVGDIIGSVYEFANTKSTDFELFTPWEQLENVIKGMLELVK